MKALIFITGLIVTAVVLSSESTSAPEQQMPRRGWPMGAVYGVESGQALDIYTPKESESRPVVVFVHGGAWRIGDYKHVGVKPFMAIREKMIFASIEYRRVPLVTWEEQVQDVADGVAWLKKNVAELGGDPDRIVLMGHSSGAHVVSLLATDPRFLKKHELAPQDLAGLVTIDTAAYDIPVLMKGLSSTDKTRKNRQGQKLRSKIYSRVFGETEAGWKLASPAHHIEAKQKFPPMFLMHLGSRHDSTMQTKAFAKQVRDAGGEATTYAFESGTHSSINTELGRIEYQPTEELAKFLRRVTSKK